MGPYIFFYCLIGAIVFLVNADAAHDVPDGWKAFARGVLWPLLTVLYLFKYGVLAIVEVWSD